MPVCLNIFKFRLWGLEMNICLRYYTHTAYSDKLKGAIAL